MLMIVDSDKNGAHLLQQALKRQQPELSIELVSNGLQALELGHCYGAQLRLTVVEVKLAFLDGRFLATALRRLNPSMIIVPYTASREALGFFTELGCAEPIIKPCTPTGAATHILAAYKTAAPLPPDTAWFAAMCAQVDMLPYSSVARDWRWPMLESQSAERERLEKARTLLQRYTERTASHMRGRELAQSIKLIDQCLSA